MPKELRRDTVTVRLCDCRDHDLGIPAATWGSADMIFADPPFGASNAHATHWGERHYASLNAEWDRGDAVPSPRSWIAWCVKALKLGGDIYVESSFHNAAAVLRALSELCRTEQAFDPLLGTAYGELELKNHVVWHRTNAIPMKRARQAGIFKHGHENLFRYRKVRYTKLGRRVRGIPVFNYFELKARNLGIQMGDVWSFSFGGRPEFRAATPEEMVIRAVMASTNPGDLVLCPFAGSGTEAAVCLAMGRRYLGWEKHPEHFEIIRRRLKDKDDQEKIKSLVENQATLLDSAKARLKTEAKKLGLKVTPR